MQGFHFITTEDGSPSLRLGETEPLSEAMHSLKGAFSETLYIYGTALELGIREGFAPRTLSMGLGLGYIELLAAGHACKHEIADFGGESFEIVPELREWFTDWLAGKEIPGDFERAYDEIEERTCRHLELKPGAAKAALHEAVSSGRWLLRDALTPSTIFEGKFGVICFDAFSSKSTPELWSEEFLNAFLQKGAAPGRPFYLCMYRQPQARFAGLGFRVADSRGFLFETRFHFRRSFERLELRR
ncbi:MAG: hypothetical protein V4760_03120 [Bdellovibrionota bacterium]